MALRVLKPFKTVNRKFATGDAVSESDIDAGSFFSLSDWIARGFVADDAVPAPAKVPAFSKSTAKADTEAPQP
jgi:hypothetical protein